MTKIMKPRRVLPLALAGALALVAVMLTQGASPVGAVTDSTAICTAPTGGGDGSTELNAVEFDLSASADYVGMPDGNQILMWSYGATNGFQAPGPTMCVLSGQWVKVNLTNSLPAATSVSFPGQTGVTSTGDADGLFTSEAAALGGTSSYTFNAAEPGTYLYESGTDAAIQIQMGLYGAVIVRPAFNTGWAYDDADTAFDPAFEYLLLMHEIDPVLHQLVEAGGDLSTWDPSDRHNRYWTLNGRAFPDVIAPNNAPWLPNQPQGGMVQIEANPLDAGHAEFDPARLPALVRYANAGLDNHPFHPHGNHLRVIGQDGRSLGDSGIVGLDGTVEAFSKTVASGSTYELLAEWRDVDAWATPGASSPVTIPGLEDIVFKDGVTFYSGSESLGETGILPEGHTTFTECGEYYFPWHSHALNEVQNFNEGFGGMLTLWRVDPPGGCA